MQHFSRLKYNSKVLALKDELAVVKQEHDDSIQRVRELTNERIILPTVERTKFETELATAHEDYHPLMCQHSRLLWQTCSRCKRDAKQAQAYRVHYQRVVKRSA